MGEVLYANNPLVLGISATSDTQLTTDLFMRVDQYVALDAFLTHVSPAVSAHPLPLALGTFVFSETTFLALIWRQAFSFWTSLMWKQT